jgi:hypothetical protein
VVCWLHLGGGRRFLRIVSLAAASAARIFAIASRSLPEGRKNDRLTFDSYRSLPSVRRFSTFSLFKISDRPYFGPDKQAVSLYLHMSTAAQCVVTGKAKGRLTRMDL